MNITTEQIHAFLEVSRKLSISKAALSLGLTQAALSIRIQKLEDQLECTLLTRSRSGLVLTDAGQKFLTYAQTFESLEQEWIQDFRQSDTKLHGDIRIACYSTIGRSLVLPSLYNLLEENENLKLNYAVRETHELYQMLKSSEVDFIFLDEEIKFDGIEQILLGHEEYVLIQSKTSKSNLEIFLNHDEKDFTSFEYFKFIGKPKNHLNRRYLDEIYSVIDAVAEGIGVSVLPLHLIKEDKRIKIALEKKMKKPVYLTFKKRPYYTPLFKKTQSAIESFMKKHLKQ